MVLVYFCNKIRAKCFDDRNCFSVKILFRSKTRKFFKNFILPNMHDRSPDPREARQRIISGFTHKNK